jgi:hypothetical protein
VTSRAIVLDADILVRAVRGQQDTVILVDSLQSTKI